MPRQSRRKIKGGDCGCNANHAIGSMSGGSGYLNPATFSSTTIPSNSYYQYNSAIGNASDPITTGQDGNMISARNLPNMSSTGGKSKRKSKKSNKKQTRKRRKSNRKRKVKGGNNEMMNTKINDYMTNTVSIPHIKGGHAHTYNNENLQPYGYVMDKVPYTPTYVSGGKKSKKSKTKKSKKGGNLAFSIFNQMSNPITSFGNISGAYNSANIATGNGQLGDNAVYNQPASNGYGPNNPYLI